MRVVDVESDVRPNAVVSSQEPTYRRRRPVPIAPIASNDVHVGGSVALEEKRRGGRSSTKPREPRVVTAHSDRADGRAGTALQSDHLNDDGSDREFLTDTRAIEGLPVRLVIALVVGVASLSVMLGMLSGIDGLAVTELDAQPEPEIVTPGEQSIDVTVIDPDGSPVADATVVIRGETARQDGVAYADTGEDGTATIDVSPQLRPNQSDGTLRIDIKPPAGSNYADERPNTEILVVSE